MSEAAFPDMRLQDARMAIEYEAGIVLAIFEPELLRVKLSQQYGTTIRNTDLSCYRNLFCFRSIGQFDSTSKIMWQVSEHDRLVGGLWWIRIRLGESVVYGETLSNHMFNIQLSDGSLDYLGWDKQ